MFIKTILTLIVLFFSLSIPQVVFAKCEDTAAAQFQSLCKINATDNMTIVRDVIQGLFVIAALATLFFLIYGGLKWVLSGGDKAKIGEARGMITAAIVGLIVTFLSFTIINVITAIFGLRTGSIFVIPQLTNQQPLPPTDVTNVAPDCTDGPPC